MLFLNTAMHLQVTHNLFLCFVFYRFTDGQDRTQSYERRTVEEKRGCNASRIEKEGDGKNQDKLSKAWKHFTEKEKKFNANYAKQEFSFYCTITMMNEHLKHKLIYIFLFD